MTGGNFNILLCGVCCLCVSENSGLIKVFVRTGITTQ